MPYTKQYPIRWADLDPNGHMRHSAYYDYAAQHRLDYLHDHGFPLGKFAQLAIGPILFREEARFLKEISPNETISVAAELAGLSEDGSRWRIVHTLYKADGREAAVVTVDGAWLDLRLRKLATPPTELAEALSTLERHSTFAPIERRPSAGA
ncbi:thioesterase [Hymenobacter busanensis]|uniref:Thioesterase n=2 Tax=Hymenobacter busanensis TaxID=2607656 RepID=A0A7L5A589_9BACT|nr:thioesterase family protein [Hymenobacter busanensis]KAA9339931.1 thioesterase [Hymenobacter busanensis]QHJ09600.1 thioesterase [Hymenobacter busanensis]